MLMLSLFGTFNTQEILWVYVGILMLFNEEGVWGLLDNFWIIICKIVHFSTLIRLNSDTYRAILLRKTRSDEKGKGDGERGSSGPSQENFEMKWYKSCKSVQIWIIHQRKRFYLRSCLCQSDSASVFWYFIFNVMSYI